MKLTKLMLSASIAALALVSCNKQDTTPQPVSNRLKTVQVSLENIVFTKGNAGNKILDNQAVAVKSFQIFLTDAAGNEYEGKNEAGTAAAKTYWDAADLAGGLPVTGAEFHYVDPNCTKVVAVANMPTVYATYAEFKTAAATSLEIAGQQKQDELALYAESGLTAAGTHTDFNTVDGTTYESEVYQATLMLTPRIARFEVDGFSVIFTDPLNPKYNEIKITQLAVQNYYPEAKIISNPVDEVVVEGTPVNHIPDFSLQADVYDWLDTPETPQPWYRDYCDLTIIPTDNVKDLPADGKLAYHLFACDGTVPVFVIKLTADGQPAYLYTKKLKDGSGTEITEFKPGYIYRMSGEGEAGAGSNGTIEIPEDKIDPMDRCLDITVDVMKWKVVLVTPEF